MLSKNMRMRKFPRQSGQALITVAFALVVLLAAAGLAVDMGYLRYQRRLQQSAADSAALAGAAAAGTGGNVSQAANDDATLNGFQNGVTLPGAQSPVSVTVIGPMTFNGHPNAVRVVITANHPTFFMRIFGATMRSASVATAAVAQYTSAHNCMYALAGGNGITVSANVNVPNCGVLSAQNLAGGGHLTAASIGVVGSAANITTPAAITGILQPRDPLANLPAPAVGGGGNYNITTTFPSGGGTANVPAGSYNGISVPKGLARAVHLNGVYSIGAGGLSFLGSGNVTGTNVTFYLNGGSVTLGVSQHFSLTAPTNGAYAGILFFQKKTNTATAAINGAGGSHFQGALYFPGADLHMNGGGTGAGYMILVARTLHLNTNISFNSNYNSLANGSPIKAATLVQ
jgi:hypothetical protein